MVQYELNVLLTVRVPRAAGRQCLVPEFRAAVHQDSLATETASAAVLPTPGRDRRRSSAVRAATVSVFELYPAAIAFHSRTMPHSLSSPIHAHVIYKQLNALF